MRWLVFLDFGFLWFLFFLSPFFWLNTMRAKDRETPSALWRWRATRRASGTRTRCATLRSSSPSTTRTGHTTDSKRPTPFRFRIRNTTEDHATPTRRVSTTRRVAPSWTTRGRDTMRRCSPTDKPAAENRTRSSDFQKTKVTTSDVTMNDETWFLVRLVRQASCRDCAKTCSNESRKAKNKRPEPFTKWNFQWWKFTMKWCAICVRPIKAKTKKDFEFENIRPKDSTVINRLIIMNFERLWNDQSIDAFDNDFCSYSCAHKCSLYRKTTTTCWNSKND